MKLLQFAKSDKLLKQNEFHLQGIVIFFFAGLGSHRFYEILSGNMKSRVSIGECNILSWETHMHSSYAYIRKKITSPWILVENFSLLHLMRTCMSTCMSDGTHMHSSYAYIKDNYITWRANLIFCAVSLH